MGSLEFWLDYWDSFFAFFMFGLFHSVCAREPFKEFLSNLVSPFFVEHFWRIIYCSISYLMLYNWIMYLHFEGHEDGNILLFDNEYYDNIRAVVRLFSVVVLYMAFIRSDYLQFLGFKQLWKGIKSLTDSGKKQPKEELFGTDVLEVDGIYSWVRHPMLSSGWLFLASSYVTANSIVLLIMYTIYMFIGGHYEEKRLLRVFGSQYTEYIKNVGSYFPKASRFASVLNYKRS